MRKDLNVKLSWMSEDNWKFFIEQGFLPILAINHPRHNSGTRVHFPELAPKMKVLRKFENPGEEYYNWLRETSKYVPIFISEQVMPEDFSILWEKDAKRTVGKDNNFKACEKLYFIDNRKDINNG